MCTFEECLCTGLFGTLGHDDPSSFLVKGEHPTPTLGLCWDWLCRGFELSAARQCRAASKSDGSLGDWHWTFNVKPACTTIWSAGEPQRLNVD